MCTQKRFYVNGNYAFRWDVPLQPFVGLDEHN